MLIEKEHVRRTARAQHVQDRRWQLLDPCVTRLAANGAEGPRPIAVATQFAGEEGATLVNDAERFAEAAWQRHFRPDRIPPIWIQRVIYGEDRRSGHISSTTFQVVGTRANTDSTRHLTGAELRRRNSQTWLDASSTGRGEQYVPNRTGGARCRPWPRRATAISYPKAPWHSSTSRQDSRGGGVAVLRAPPALITA